MSRATDITLEGNSTADDSIQLFSVSVAAPATVDLRSYGYAGGTTSTGTVVPPGGFDSILTLFSASGTFITDNDDGAGVATDPTTGLAADARITTHLGPGSYIATLTQYDNFSIGNLVDGFAEAGNPNFTADPSFTTGGPCPGNMFRDSSGTAGRCRNGSWALDFVNTASVTPVAPVPEPSALLLAGAGLAFLLISRAPRRKATVLTGGLVVALASLPLGAQTCPPPPTAGPDYCHVSDFLNGQRNLLNVTDLQIVTLVPGDGPTFTQIKTSNSTQTPGGPFQYGLNIDTSRQAATFSAQMFNQPNAVTITTLHNFNGYLGLWLQNIVGSAINPNGNSAWTPLPQGDDPDVTAGAVADFTQDGFDDLAVGLVDGRIFVVSPTSTDPSQQPFTGSFRSTANPIPILNQLNAMAAGDFKGDGHKELAGLTTIPLSAPGGGGLALVTYTVDPNSLAVTPVTTLYLTTPDASPSTPITHSSMTTGRFTSLTHDQLAVAFATDSDRAVVEVIDFDANLNAKEIAQSRGNPTAPGITTGSGYIEVKAGKFGLPNNDYDQIVYHNSSPYPNPGNRFFAILSIDPTTLEGQLHQAVLYDEVPCSAGIQVGNFDHRQADPLHPGQTQHNPNSQIALLYCTGNTDGSGNMQFTLNIYSSDPSSLNLNGNPDSVTNNVVAGFPVFAATDLQGRSVTLGEPTKITIDSAVSPTVIVGAPPMHVDFISPNPLGGVPPEILNVSAVPDAFNTTYDFENSSENLASTTNKTSWSFGAQETFNGSLTVGDPEEGTGFKESDTLTAAQNLKGASESTHGTFGQSSISLQTTTGLGDQIIYTDSQFNIWIYPVIGQTVCPATTPNCQANQKVPLTIQFSAPNGNPQTNLVPGINLAWYQPPWEPGNLLSYPANLNQLNAAFSNLTPLTNAVQFATATGSVTERVGWANQSQTSSTSSFKQNYSFDNNFSVDGGFGITDVVHTGVGLGLDLSGSYGLSTLSQSSNQIAASSGLNIQAPGNTAGSNYAYIVMPSIMGNTAGPNVVDQPPNTTDQTSVQTFGRLYAMYMVNPLDTNNGAGNWWAQAYAGEPDVALNHPKRWNSTTTTLIGTIPSNCLATGKGPYDCLTPSEPDPNNPLGDDFHIMRGFFIAKSNTQNQNFQNQGPQLEVAKAGDVLNLSARVYNYSVQDMTTSTQVHARFYYMLWDTNNASPLNNGASTLISEVTLAADPSSGTGPIPKFAPDKDAPNWKLVGTTFNTGDFPDTKYGNVSLVFWVVVWMEDGNGLVTELPNHGLPAIPPAFASWTAALNFECQSANNCYSSNAGINVMSNNIGIYPSAFYIAGPSLGATPGPVSASVDMGKLDVSADRVALTQKVNVFATLSAEGAEAGSMSVLFYDGNPKQDGRLFDVQRIAHIAEGRGYKVMASYRPSTCGKHELFAVINRGQSNEVIRRAHPIRVACEATR